MLRFFALTYTLTWTCFILAATLSGGMGSFAPAFSALGPPLLFLGTFAPALVALGLTAWDEGRPGTKALVDRLFEWPAGWQWYTFAVGYIAAIKLTAAIAHRLISGAWPPFGNESWYVIAAAIVISTPIQAGEEMGWRGYALPRLAARFGFASASLMLGLVWGVWHLPLFFVAGLGNYGQSFPVFVLGSTMLSVAIAWLYAHTNGSLLLAMLMHSAANQTTGIVPTRMANPGNPFALDTSLVTLLSVAIGLMTVGYFLARMPKVEVPGRVDRAVAL